MNKALELAGLALTLAACAGAGEDASASLTSETSDVAASRESALSRVTLGPFEDTPIGHGVFLYVKEGAAGQPEARELVYTASLPTGETLNLIAALPIDGALPQEMGVGHPPAPRVGADGQLSSSASDVVVVHLQENRRIISAASGSMSIVWESEGQVSMRLDELSFVDSVRATVRGYEQLNGTISGSLMPACAFIDSGVQPTLANRAGQVISRRPQHTWDTSWSSSYCARMRPELEALFGVEL